MIILQSNKDTEVNLKDDRWLIRVKSYASNFIQSNGKIKSKGLGMEMDAENASSCSLHSTMS